MSVQHETAGAKRERTGPPILPLVLIIAIAFLAGLAVMGWVVSHWTGAASFVGVTEPAPVTVAPIRKAPAPAPPAAAAPPSSSQEPQRLVIDPEITRRVTRLEQEFTQLTAQSRAAAGNADRAEGLLVAFAARRALDRGVPLGYIEGLLRRRFGDTQPQAVATIITASRQPVTLEELQEGLQQVGPELVGAGPDQNWWDALKAEFAGLVTIRKSGTPSTMPAERLRRATRRLESGQVDVALAEVLRMPGRENAQDWIADARRYVAARRALDTIETAALLEPRTPPKPTAPTPEAQAPKTDNPA